MGRICTDIALRTMFMAAIADLRRNPWLLPDIFGVDLEKDVLARIEYKGEQKNAIEWFLSTEINVVMYLRKDDPKFPCISIALSESSEDVSRTTLGDTAFEPIQTTDPRFLQMQRTKVYSDFTPVAYDPATGDVTLPPKLNTSQIAPGIHMLVDSTTNKGYVIKKVIDADTFRIAENCGLNLKNCFIAPVLDAWNVHIGYTQMKESYEVGVHGNSQPMEAIWLSQIVEYCLLKYKAQYLDRRNLKLATFSSSNLSLNNNYGGDNVFSRFFRLSFRTEMYWVDSVHPRIAQVAGQIVIADGPATPEEYWKNRSSWIMEGDKNRPDEEDCE